MILDRHSFGIWSTVAKRAFKATFKKPSSKSTGEVIRKSLRNREITVYIHIPFCNGTCTYCPYVRYPIRDKKMISKYVKALKVEIKKYGELFQDQDLKVVDVHIGGGTPSLLNGQQFEEISNVLAEHFGAEAKMAIEANPEDLAEEEHVFDLTNHGVSEVSLGVQSFQLDILKKLGRRNDAKDSLKAIENLRDAGVEYINVDMMYMIPGQSLDNWIADLNQASEQDVDEITCYPLLIAEHCLGYKLMKERKMNQPSKRVFKKMVYATEDVLNSSGFKPVEIYGYSRRDGWKYATVNYEMEGPLLGFGCGAMGFTGGYEYQNTCSLPEYIKTTFNEELPIAGSRTVDIQERAIRYATCKLFICRKLVLVDFKQKVGDFSELVGGSGFGKALRLLRLLGYVEKSGESMEITRKGLFAAHLICWAFVLNIPCRISEEYLKMPWPLKVTIP